MSIYATDTYTPTLAECEQEDWQFAIEAAEDAMADLAAMGYAVNESPEEYAWRMRWIDTSTYNAWLESQQ